LKRDHRRGCSGCWLLAAALAAWGEGKKAKKNIAQTAKGL